MAISSEENMWKRHAFYGGSPAQPRKDRIAHRSLAKHLTCAASILLAISDDFKRRWLRYEQGADIHIGSSNDHLGFASFADQSDCGAQRE